MNLEQLAGFAMVAKVGHFTRAASQLHLAQPSLSRQIASLERELKVELFHRVRGKVTLTAAGEHLLPIARRMLADAETARNEMAELVGLRRGRVRLGATPTLCTSLVAEVLVGFRARHPDVDIEILERGSRSLIEELVEGALDLALIVTSVPSERARSVIAREPILTERLVAVSASNSACLFDSEVLLGGGAVSLSQLASIPHISFPESYDLRAAMDTAFKAQQLTPQIAVEGAEMDAALRFAERGIGVAVVPAMVAALRSSLTATPLTEAELTRTISIARRTDMAPTHAALAMSALIKETADSLAALEPSLVSRVK